MSDNIENGYGAQALDVEQLNRRYQNAVVSGCAVSDGSGALEVDVDDGDAIVAGTRYSVSATTLTLAAADPADPRKDVIYVDSSGAPAVATGTPAPARPADEIRRDTYTPAPPDLSQTDACVLAEVWVAAGTSDTGSADISDRRLFADVVADSGDFNSINTDEIANINVAPQSDSDLGQTLNGYDATLSEGSVVVIPPGSHDWSTTYTPSKRLVILGYAQETNYATGTGTVVNRQADVPLIDPDDNIGLAIKNIRFEDAIAGASTGVYQRGSCWIENPTFRGFGGDALHLEQTGSSNLNSSKVFGANLNNITGDGIRVTNPSANPPDINGMKLHVENATVMGGYAVYKGSGFGDEIEVTLAEDFDNGNGNVCYVGTLNSYWLNRYSEKVGTIFEFQEVYNTAKYQSLSGVTNTDNGNLDNLVINRGSPGDGAAFKRTFGPFSVGSNLQVDSASILYGGSRGEWTQKIDTNGDHVFERPDGTRVASIDQNGNLTLLGSLTENGSP